MTETTQPDVAEMEWVLVPRVPTEAMERAFRRTVRYLSHPSTPWSSGQVAHVYGRTLAAAPQPPRAPGARETLPADWLAREFATVDAEIAGWPKGLRKSFKDACAAAPQPPEPAEDVAALRTERSKIYSDLTEARAALAEAKAELERVEKIAHDLTVALTDLTSGGSECFIRRGTGDRERYYADADFCSRRIRERIAGAEDRWRAEAEKRQRLTAERDRLAEAARAVRPHLSRYCASVCMMGGMENGPEPAARLLNAALSSLSAPEQPAEPSEAARDVLAERRRQIEVEGWSPEHDNAHDHGELARAAVCYADPLNEARENAPPKWPWHTVWWKPKDRRRDLVRAAALIIAEIERLDRAALAAKGGEHG